MLRKYILPLEKKKEEIIAKLSQDAGNLIKNWRGQNEGKD